MKKFKKQFSILLILMLLLNSMSVFGEEVVDVDEDNWAEPFVQNVVKSNTMPIYDDGEFKPLQKVTKMEVLNVIYRIAVAKGEVTHEKTDEYLEKYQESIDGLLIPTVLLPYGSDNHRALAYALENGILRSSELSFVYSNGDFQVISKVDVSVYIGKALNVYLKENVNKFYEIIYKDGSEITLMAWPYVNLLIEKDIISKEGIDGYFYPNSVINRDILSVYATGVLAEIIDYVPGENTDVIDITKTVSSFGKISIIHYDKNIIEIRDSSNNLNVYDASNVVIKLNGQEVSIQNLEPNLKVKVKASGRNLISLEVVQEFDTVEGDLKDISRVVTMKGETYRVLTIYSGSEIKFFKALSSVIVERDYHTSKVEELVEGDVVTVSYTDLYAKKVEAFSKKVVLEGVLQRSSAFNKGDAISVKLSNGKMIEQTLLNDIVKINVNDDTVKGDIVKVTLEAGLVTAIEATGLSSEANGRITQITISENPSVTILNNKGTAKVYNIADNVVLRNLGVVDGSGIYALRLDQDITLELSGLLVDKISINKAVEKAQFEAQITEIHKNINIIKAKDIDGKEWTISLEGSAQNISDYVIEDNIFVYGVELSQDIFEADLIIILE